MFSRIYSNSNVVKHRLKADFYSVTSNLSLSLSVVDMKSNLSGGSTWSDQSNDSLIQFYRISEITNRIVLLQYFLFGLIGNLLNVLLFTRPALKRTSTSIYLLAASIANLVVVLFVLPFRLLADGFQLDPTASSIVACRIISYIYHVFLAIPPFFNIMACADRWAATSLQVNRRRLATFNHAKHWIPIPIVMALVLYVYVLFTFTAEPTPPPPFCSVEDDYAVPVLSFYLIIYSVIPPSLMIFFSVNILYNVYRQRDRIAPTIRAVNTSLRSGSGQQARRPRFSQMQLMLICQSTIDCTFTLPFCLINLVSLIMINNEHFLLVYSLLRLLTFFNYISSFYVYTLSSRLYRRELREFFKSFCRGQ